MPGISDSLEKAGLKDENGRICYSKKRRTQLLNFGRKLSTLEIEQEEFESRFLQDFQFSADKISLLYQSGPYLPLQ